MTESEWLAQLKAGDELFSTQNYGEPCKPDVVSRTTRTMIFVRVNDRCEAAYRRKDGRSVGRDSYSTQFIRQPDDALRERFALRQMMNKARMLRERLAIPQDRPTLTRLIAALEPFVKGGE